MKVMQFYAGKSAAANIIITCKRMKVLKPPEEDEYDDVDDAEAIENVDMNKTNRHPHIFT